MLLWSLSIVVRLVEIVKRQYNFEEERPFVAAYFAWLACLVLYPYAIFTGMNFWTMAMIFTSVMIVAGICQFIADVALIIEGNNPNEMPNDDRIIQVVPKEKVKRKRK